MSVADALKFTPDDLAEVLGADKATRWYTPLLQAFGEGRIITARRQAHFLAQVSVESQGFTALIENLHYTSAARIFAVFRRHFDSLEEAAHYVGKPRELANRVYGDRMGNRGSHTDDGWNYRGRGLLHHTGLGEYLILQNRLKLPLVSKPELLSDPTIAARAAADFWTRKKVRVGLFWYSLNALADRGNLEAVTLGVNGGYNGLEERKKAYSEWAQALGVA